jgi:tetratricopeptide (TPR) repeat protein
VRFWAGVLSSIGRISLRLKSGKGTNWLDIVEDFDPVSNLRLVKQIVQKTTESGKLIRDTLAAFVAQNPEDCILRLLAAAVETRAKHFVVDCNEMDFSVEWDGRPIPPQLVIDLFNGIELKLEVGRSIKTLIMGAKAALSLGADLVEVELWNPSSGSGTLLVLKPGAPLAAEPLRRNTLQRPTSTVRVRVSERKKLKILGKWVTRIQGQQDLPEIEILKTRACHTGLELLVNRSRFNRPFDFGRSFALCNIVPVQPIPCLAIEAEVVGRGQIHSKTINEPCYLNIAVGSPYPEKVGLTLICAGSSYKSPIVLPMRNVSVVATCFGLESDPSFQHILKNPAFDALVKVVEREIMLLVGQLFGERGGIPEHRYQTAVPLLEDYAAHRRSAGDVQEAGLSLRSAVEFQTKLFGAGHPELIDNLKNLVQLYEMGFSSPQRRQDLEMLSTCYANEAENLAQKHRVQESTDLWCLCLDFREKYGIHLDDLSQRYHNLAVKMQEARIAGSESMFLRALQLGEGSSVEDPSAKLDSLMELAQRYKVRRSYDEAEKYAKNALSLAEASFGSEDKKLVPILKILAEVIKAAGRYAEATDIESRALTLRFGKKASG